jgi:hypothetical protein
MPNLGFYHTVESPFRRRKLTPGLGSAGGGGFLSPVVCVWSPIRLTGAAAQNTLMPADALRLNAIHDA